MLTKIRAYMNVFNNGSLSGEVEIDETFVGGKNKNRPADKKVKNSQGRSFKDKVPVFGMLQRNGNMVAKVVDNTKSSTLEPYIKNYVKEESVIYTDGWDYGGLNESYIQRSVDHGSHFYGTTLMENLYK